MVDFRAEQHVSKHRTQGRKEGDRAAMPTWCRFVSGGGVPSHRAPRFPLPKGGGQWAPIERAYTAHNPFPFTAGGREERCDETRWRRKRDIETGNFAVLARSAEGCLRARWSALYGTAAFKLS